LPLLYLYMFLNFINNFECHTSVFYNELEYDRNLKYNITCFVITFFLYYNAYFYCQIIIKKVIVIIPLRHDIKHFHVLYRLRRILTRHMVF